MSLLAQIFHPKLRADVTRVPWDEFWYNANPHTMDGASLTPDGVLRMSAVHCAVRILSKTVAQVPLIVYRRKPDGGKERAANHPLFDVLRSQPNAWQTSFEWREQMMAGYSCAGMLTT